VIPLFVVTTIDRAKYRREQAMGEQNLRMGEQTPLCRDHHREIAQQGPAD